jgi:hypothetical protein
MKEKDPTNGEELESINNNLFGSFDPEDESWLVGGSTTLTTSHTFTPEGFDALVDVDWAYAEVMPS